MYAAMFLLSIAQVLYLPNWFAGPTYLLTFGLLYLLRVGRKERMMLDRFGSEYEAYMQRTGRLIPAFRKQPSIPQDERPRPSERGLTDNPGPPQHTSAVRTPRLDFRVHRICARLVGGCAGLRPASGSGGRSVSAAFVRLLH